MFLAPAVAFSDFILAIHILAVVIGFGVVFAFPIMLSTATRLDPGVLPGLLRARQRAGRYLVNPGLLVLLLAGIYLATDEDQWKSFYVQWGVAAVIVIGALEGSLMNPRSGRLAGVAERDLAATGVAAGGQRVSAQWSSEYVRGQRLLSIGGWLIAVIVVITVFLMATHAGR
ncbi:MAG: DUF2269 domain-containing protein [Actinomycetota bacterium]|nr:DUF2269 domain-containing protein [Actinomycetota bacterium]